MPYARNADLPASVRNPLPDAAQTLFRRVVNAALARGDSEESAFRQAWATVSEHYEKPENGGKWVAKKVRKRKFATLYIRRNVENAEEQPCTGSIELDPEILEELNENWEANHVEKQCNTIVVSLDQKAFYTADQVQEIIKRLSEATANGATVISVSPKVEKREPEKRKFNFIKVNKKLGLIFGWAIVSKIGGEEYFDLQGDHIPEDAMLEAATEFMEKKRTLKLMHKGEPKGDVVFAWPLTEEIAKAMGIRTQVTGLMVAVKPTSKKLIEAAENGELQGFSIGGLRLVDEEVE